MKNEKNLNENPAFQELPDESLDAVAGGGDGDFNFDENTNPANNTTKPVGWDSRGNATHWQHGSEIVHYECPKCGRLLHKGTLDMLYCDPCDDWFSDGLFGSAVRVEGWYKN